MFKKNDEVIVKIDDISVNVQGIGKIDGAVFFCAGLIPGEKARVKVIKETKRYYVAIPIEILQESKYRIDPPCPVFKRCGGCTLQHTAYEKQLDLKRDRILNSFNRIGGFNTKVKECVASPMSYNYRNKAVFPVKRVEGKVVTGFYAPGSHDIVDTPTCMIHQDKINQVLEITRNWIDEYNISTYDEKTTSGLIRHIFARVSNPDDVMAGLISNSEHIPNLDKLIENLNNSIDGFKNFSINVNDKNTNVIIGDKTICLYGSEYITHEIDGLKFDVKLKSFLQVNTPQTEQLYNKALEYADIKKDDVIIDLYCGIGTITLLAARRAEKVYGIEFLSESTISAKSNAEKNNIDNVQFICGDCTKEYSSLIKKIETVNTLILDPPRKGLDSLLIDKIIASKPKKIVYISCDPGTLSRDLKLFSDAYDIVEATPFDLFPQTTHVECVVILNKISI